MTGSLGRKLDAGIAAAALVLALIGWNYYRNVSALMDVARSIVHTHDVLQHLEAIMATGGDAADLRPLMTDNPVQQARLDSLGSLRSRRADAHEIRAVVNAMEADERNLLQARTD